MYYIGFGVHKKAISYRVKNGSGQMHAESAIPATRFDLDRWRRTLPQAWTAAMEAPHSRDGSTIICIPTPRR